MIQIKTAITKILIIYLLIIIMLTIVQNPEFNTGTKLLFLSDIIYFSLEPFNKPYEYYLTLMIYFCGFYLLIFNQNDPNEKMTLTLVSILPHLYYEISFLNN